MGIRCDGAYTQTCEQRGNNRASDYKHEDEEVHKVAVWIWTQRSIPDGGKGLRAKEENSLVYCEMLDVCGLLYRRTRLQGGVSIRRARNEILLGKIKRGARTDIYMRSAVTDITAT